MNRYVIVLLRGVLRCYCVTGRMQFLICCPMFYTPRKGRSQSLVPEMCTQRTPPPFLWLISILLSSIINKRSSYEYSATLFSKHDMATQHAQMRNGLYTIFCNACHRTAFSDGNTSSSLLWENNKRKRKQVQTTAGHVPLRLSRWCLSSEPYTRSRTACS